MNGWQFVMIVLMFLVIVLSILMIKTRKKVTRPYGFSDFFRYNSAIQTILIVSSVVLLVIAICNIVIPLNVKNEVEEFKQYQEVINASYVEYDETVNVALGLKIAEMNMWLAESRAAEETFGIFSFYKGKLTDIEYISIHHEEDN